jgi:hypothetical protein
LVVDNRYNGGNDHQVLVLPYPPESFHQFSLDRFRSSVVSAIIVAALWRSYYAYDCGELVRSAGAKSRNPGQGYLARWRAHDATVGRTRDAGQMRWVILDLGQLPVE